MLGEWCTLLKQTHDSNSYLRSHALHTTGLLDVVTRKCIFHATTVNNSISFSDNKSISLSEATV